MRFVLRPFSAILIFAMVLSASLGFARDAQPDRGLALSASRIQTAATAAPPLGFQLFCMRTPEHCTASARDEVAMSPELINILSSVNRSVNASITPRVRPVQTWELGARAGDCKDYVLNKRHRLIGMGVPAGALRIAIGYTAWGEGHTVLVVRTSAGDLVLDNLDSQIRGWDETGHQLVAMSSSDPRQWRQVR